MKKFLFAVIAAFLLTAQASLAAFPDVTNSTNYYQAITWLQSQNVVMGYPDGTFKPDQNVNRAEFLKMLYETLGDTESVITGFSVFPDVPQNEWYTKYIKTAFEQGVVQGYPDGYFRPENFINRAEAMKIVMRQFFNNQPEEFFSSLSAVAKSSIEGCESEGHFLSDVTANSWFEPYFTFAHDKCLIPEAMIGNNPPPYDDLIYPSNLLTRGEMAELLYRAKAMEDSSANKYSNNLIPSDVKIQSTQTSDVEWLTYEDSDISFTYPETFLGTTLQEDFDQNLGRTQWEVTRQDNTIYIRPNFESPAAEFGATYEIKILDDTWGADEEWSKAAQAHAGVESQWGEKLTTKATYYYVGVLRDLDFGLGQIADVYALVPGGIDGLGKSNKPMEKHFIIYAYPDLYSSYVEDILVPSIKAK